MVQEEFHIHDFIENYEEYDNPDIQWKTSSREEFLELKGNKREKRPEIGKFFKHQDLFFRYLLVHDRILTYMKPDRKDGFYYKLQKTIKNI